VNQRRRRRTSGHLCAPVLIVVLALSPVRATARIPTQDQDTAALYRLIDSRAYEQAEETARELINRDRNDAEVWELLGRARQGRWDFEGAAEAYRRAIDLGRETAPLLRGWVETRGRSASNVSLFFTAGRLKRDLERALELDPRHVESRAILAAFYYMVPRLLGGDKRKADKLIDELIELSPADGYYLRGVRAREEDKSTERILGAWNEALANDPYHTLTLMEMGRFAFNHEHDDQAVEYYRRAVESAPADPLVQTSWGRALRRVRRYEESAAAFRRALEIDPYWFDARQALAEYYERIEDTPAAIREYETLLRNNPHSEPDEIRARLHRLRGG